MTAEPVQSPNFSSPVNEPKGEIVASVPQIAILNNHLPCGFRFELYENARKFDPSTMLTGKRKKTVFSLFASSIWEPFS